MNFNSTVKGSLLEGFYPEGWDFEKIDKCCGNSPEEITKIVEDHNKEPHLRNAQKVLAREIITFLHGKEEFERAINLADNLFNNKENKGRKPLEVDEKKFRSICSKWRSGEITASAAMKELGLKPNTFYRRVKEMGL